MNDLVEALKEEVWSIDMEEEIKKEERYYRKFIDVMDKDYEYSNPKLPKLDKLIGNILVNLKCKDKFHKYMNYAINYNRGIDIELCRCRELTPRQIKDKFKEIIFVYECYLKLAEYVFHFFRIDDQYIKALIQRDRKRRRKGLMMYGVYGILDSIKRMNKLKDQVKLMRNE